MTKTRIVYLLLAVFLFQPALSIASEKDSGSFFGRTRKKQIEKIAVEPEAPPSPSAADSTEEPESTDAEASALLPKIPKTPITQNHGILGTNLPPKAPQDITQIPPSISDAPDILKPQIQTTMNKRTATPTVPAAVQIQVQPVQTSMEKVDSKPVRVDESVRLSDTQDAQPAPVDILARTKTAQNPNAPRPPKTMASTPNTPNSPPKVPALPKTK